ncbi:hypothetical protein, partial [Burkholderia sp. Ac-20384]|uniref:hypothetical protein n=1 Tax=Burkholderia sp. Ac-20384 TaxID=2703902 RepID=UPI00197D6C2C
KKKKKPKRRTEEMRSRNHNIDTEKIDAAHAAPRQHPHIAAPALPAQSRLLHKLLGVQHPLQTLSENTTSAASNTATATR